MTDQPIRGTQYAPRSRNQRHRAVAAILRMSGVLPQPTIDRAATAILDVLALIPGPVGAKLLRMDRREFVLRDGKVTGEPAIDAASQTPPDRLSETVGGMRIVGRYTQRLTPGPDDLDFDKALAGDHGPDTVGNAIRESLERRVPGMGDPLAGRFETPRGHFTIAPHDNHYGWHATHTATMRHSGGFGVTHAGAIEGAQQWLTAQDEPADATDPHEWQEITVSGYSAATTHRMTIGTVEVKRDRQPCNLRWEWQAVWGAGRTMGRAHSRDEAIALAGLALGEWEYGGKDVEPVEAPDPEPVPDQPWHQTGTDPDTHKAVQGGVRLGVEDAGDGSWNWLAENDEHSVEGRSRMQAEAVKEAEAAGLRISVVPRDAAPKRPTHWIATSCDRDQIRYVDGWRLGVSATKAGAVSGEWSWEARRGGSVVRHGHAPSEEAAKGMAEEAARLMSSPPEAKAEEPERDDLGHQPKPTVIVNARVRFLQEALKLQPTGLFGIEEMKALDYHGWLKTDAADLVFGRATMNATDPLYSAMSEVCVRALDWQRDGGGNQHTAGAALHEALAVYVSILDDKADEGHSNAE